MNLEQNLSLLLNLTFLNCIILYIYYTLVSSKRSPHVARRKQIAMKSIRRPTKIPLADESNELIAVIIPLKNKKMYFTALRLI